MNSPTTIATYLYPWEAEIARGLLESEGIQAMVADDNIVRMDWSHSLAVGGVRLMVPLASVEAARAVLVRQRQGDYEEALEREQDLPPQVCAQCGSRAFEPTYSIWWVLLLVASFGLATIFPPPRKALRCRRCKRPYHEAQ